MKDPLDERDDPRVAPARAKSLIRRLFGGGWAVLAPLLALAPAPAGALNPDLAVTQYGHRAWLADQTDGSLPQNFVFAILQTRDGYLWVGTQEGLARFDGVRFTVFNTRNTPALRHNDVWKLLEDRDGNLWLATDGREGLPAVRLGRNVRIPRPALEQLLGCELTAPPHGDGAGGDDTENVVPFGRSRPAGTL